MSVFLSFSLYFLSFAPLWLSVVFIDAMSIVKGNPHLYTECIGITLILRTSIICLIVMLFCIKSKKS